MLIKILDTVFSKTDQPNLLRVEEFSFKKEFYKKTKFGVQKHEYNGYAINTNGTFLTGLIPSITQYCRNNAITYNIENYLPPPLLAQNISHLFTLREDQKKCVEVALNTDRGVIKSPTGSGKTVLIAAIISAFPEAKILFLCHTLSLLKQTQEEFNKYNIGPSSIIDGSKKDISGKIIISTVQSLSKTKLLESLYNKFDIVFVDECHHAASTTGLYAKVLTKLTTLRRYGVTATMPKNKEDEFALEGLIGPKIADFTIEEAINQEILAIPTVELISVPTCEAIKDIKKYADSKLKDNYGNYLFDKNNNHIIEKGIYTIGIVEYRKRNRLIVESALEKNKNGKSVLIYVTMIEHGERLMEMFKLMGASPIFIRGSSDAELREETRQALHNKVALLAICTQAWAEGINIRSLDCILLAGGGKSEIALIQHIGRGLRRTETKKTATIIDLLDTGRYLSEHCVARLKVYVEKGWL